MQLTRPQEVLEQEKARLEQQLEANPSWRALRQLNARVSRSEGFAAISLEDIRRQIMQDLQDDAAYRSLTALELAMRPAPPSPPSKAMPQSRVLAGLLPRRPSGHETADCDTEALAFRTLVKIKPIVPAEAGPETEPSRPLLPAANKMPQSDLPAPDDLTRIRGISSRLAAELAALGIVRFKTIADWKRDDIDRVRTRLGLDRAIQRQGWIEQAARLAALSDEAKPQTRPVQQTGDDVAAMPHVPDRAPLPLDQMTELVRGVSRQPDAIPLEPPGALDVVPSETLSLAAIEAIEEPAATADDLTEQPVRPEDDQRQPAAEATEAAVVAAVEPVLAEPVPEVAPNPLARRLDLIAGISPVEMAALQTAGVTDVATIANWTAADAAIWLGRRKKLGTRAAVAHWIEQAAMLAAGRPTQHASRLLSGVVCHLVPRPAIEQPTDVLVVALANAAIAAAEALRPEALPPEALLPDALPPDALPEAAVAELRSDSAEVDAPDPVVGSVEDAVAPLPPPPGPAEPVLVVERSPAVLAPAPFAIPPPPPLIRADVPVSRAQIPPPIATVSDAVPGGRARAVQSELVAKTHVVVLVPQSPEPKITPAGLRAPEPQPQPQPLPEPETLPAPAARVVWIPLADRVPDATTEALSVIAAAAAGLPKEPKAEPVKPRTPISERLVLIDRELDWLERHRGGLMAAAALAGATATATAAVASGVASELPSSPAAEMLVPVEVTLPVPAPLAVPVPLLAPQVAVVEPPRSAEPADLADANSTAAPVDNLEGEFTAIPGAGGLAEADVTIVRREPVSGAQPVLPRVKSARALQRMRQSRADAAIDASTDASYRGHVEEASVAIVPPGSVPAGGNAVEAPRGATVSPNERPADKLRRFMKALEGR